MTIKSVRILCNSNDIVVSIDTNAAFNGMIYPKGLSKNSSCMAEFKEQISPVLYKLPLKSCSTMSSEMVSWYSVLLFVSVSILPSSIRPTFSSSLVTSLLYVQVNDNRSLTQPPEGEIEETPVVGKCACLFKHDLTFAFFLRPSSQPYVPR